MFRWIVLAVGLWAGPALASTGASPQGATSDELVASMSANPFKRNPVDIVEEKLTEKSEDQLAAERRMKEIEASEAQKLARVVFLQYPQTSVDYTNDIVQRNVKVRIARPDAKFVPEIDLYQAGRREPDRTLRPGDQRAVVPDSTIDRVQMAAEEISAAAWDSMPVQEWGIKAAELREMVKELWFVDRPELREPLFQLYVQIGRAADAMHDSLPPFYMDIGGEAVNYYWYLAGLLAHETPGLMSLIETQQLNQSVDYYKLGLDSGRYPDVGVSFTLGVDWDPRKFASEYQVFINGIERTITSRDGSISIKPGRTDIYLARADGGHSLSESVTLERIDDRIYFVRDVAQRLMGKDFIDQLMLHPNECSPDLNADIVTYLAIYAKLHPVADIYIGLAKGGSVAPQNIFLWRWDRSKSQLQRVYDGSASFPIRFVGLIGSGVIINGVEGQVDAAVDQLQPGADIDTGAVTDLLRPSFEPQIAGLPISYQLRGHYGRLMVVTGIDFALKLGGGQWKDFYQTDGHPVGPAVEENFNTGECDSALIEACDVTRIVTDQQYRERDWQRLVYTGVGVVLGRDAAIGFGPRGWLRVGWYNAPHAVDLTAHVGHAMNPPFLKKGTGRVRPILDMDFYAGVMVPFGDSSLINSGKKLGPPQFTAGSTVSAGVTF